MKLLSLWRQRSCLPRSKSRLTQLGTYQQDAGSRPRTTSRIGGNRAGRPGVATPTTEGTQLPEFTITRQIDAPVETVWAVLEDFGDIQRWSPGVTNSNLTSEGPVSEGSTRHCDFCAVWRRRRADRTATSQTLV